ncbi:hypothetical protein [Mesorhizobium shangrilense]|uniref:Uncharacterized protein n=1 Tax=Mesorhizobium shangrilense TaxID=460060 RepID=A0ABV2DMD2_9HYPH
MIDGFGFPMLLNWIYPGRGKILPSGAACRSCAARIMLLYAVAFLVALGTDPAFAHVKWFSAYDLGMPPQPLTSLINPLFIGSVLLSMCFVIVMFWFDAWLASWPAYADYMRRFEHWRRASPDLLRIGLGLFLWALWLLGGIILTPELRISSTYIGWLQFFLALCTLTWPTTLISGAGLIGLYAYGIHDYGVFHMMDYPLFLGIAVYLIIQSARLERFYRHADMILVVSLSATLLWAAVEKWLYWSWTMLLLEKHSHLALGIDHHEYIILAGFVEFVAAFLVLFGRASQILASIVLLAIFTSAIAEFGKIDAVGHLMIILALVVIILDGVATTAHGNFARRQLRVSRAGTAPLAFSAFLFLYVFAYSLMYQLAPPTDKIPKELPNSLPRRDAEK